MTVTLATTSPRRALTAPAAHTTPVVPAARLLMAHDPGAPRCEEVRALRTELLLRRASSEGADIIALLSPGTGEGRTLLAAELAIALAQSGQPTLLVDADLRHPQQHLLFGADNAQGLAQALESGTPPHSHAVKGLPQLELLSAGQSRVNPLELLSGASFAALMQHWRGQYRFVVMDTTPVAQCADALAVAYQAGRVLALCRARHTRSTDMQEMLRRLATTRSLIVGAVINHF